MEADLVEPELVNHVLRLGLAPQVALLGLLVCGVAALAQVDVSGEDDEVQDGRPEDLDVRIDLGSGPFGRSRRAGQGASEKDVPAVGDGVDDVDGVLEAAVGRHTFLLCETVDYAVRVVLGEFPDFGFFREVELDDRPLGAREEDLGDCSVRHCFP